MKGDDGEASLAIGTLARVWVQVFVGAGTEVRRRSVDSGLVTQAVLPATRTCRTKLLNLLQANQVRSVAVHVVICWLTTEPNRPDPSAIVR